MTLQNAINQPKQTTSHSMHIFLYIFSAPKSPKEWFIYSKCEQNMQLKNVHCKDKNFFEKVQISLSHWKFLQYNTTSAVNEMVSYILRAVCSVKLHVSYVVESECCQLSVYRPVPHNGEIPGVCVSSSLHLCSMGVFIVATLPSNRRFKSRISVPVTLDKRDGVLITRLAYRLESHKIVGFDYRFGQIRNSSSGDKHNAIWFAYTYISEELPFPVRSEDLI